MKLNLLEYKNDYGISAKMLELPVKISTELSHFGVLSDTNTFIIDGNVHEKTCDFPKLFDEIECACLSFPISTEENYLRVLNACRKRKNKISTTILLRAERNIYDEASCRSYIYTRTFFTRSIYYLSNTTKVTVNLNKLIKAFDKNTHGLGFVTELLNFNDYIEFI